MTRTRILALVGSLRSGAVNRQLAEAAVRHAPEDVEITIYEGLADLPFYNEDIDVAGSIPGAAKALRDAIAAADGVLMFTPEYNGTTSAVLKNAIDWGSRPYGAGALRGKAVAVVSASISPNAAKWAHADVVRAIGVAGGTVVEDSTVHFGSVGERFGDVHPREDDEAVASLVAGVRHLADAARDVVSV